MRSSKRGIVKAKKWADTEWMLSKIKDAAYFVLKMDGKK